ncbi:MAG: hypothetical protein ACLPY5_14890 [Candidatus Bathyarchaeia archaeon]
MGEAKVLQILDEYRLIVSLGRGSVHPGQKLLVYSLGDEVKDESGRTLGRLEIAKATVEVEHVQENFSTVVSPLLSETVTEQLESPFFNEPGALYGLYAQPKKRTLVQQRRETLQVEEKKGVDRTIHVGDLVRPKTIY